MKELIQTGNRSYYIKWFSNVGIYRQSDNEVYIIDSGTDEKTGMKIEAILNSRGWNLKGILCTHCHSDHIGGNAYLQKAYKCPVFARGLEAVFINHSILDPMLAYGAYPISEFLGRDMYAQASVCFDTCHRDFPKEIEILELPGHTTDHTGYRLPDGTVFLGDCIMEDRTLKKYPLSYIYNIGVHLETLKKLKMLEAEVYVISHGTASEDISHFADTNVDNINDVAAQILHVCTTPSSIEQIIYRLAEYYNIKVSCKQHILAEGMIKTYIAWLKENGRIEYIVEDNKLLWRTVK